MNIDYLTTHEFPLEKAAEAYEMIVQRSEPFLGILLRYDFDKPLGEAAVRVRDSRPAGKVQTRLHRGGQLMPKVICSPISPKATARWSVAP